MASLVEQLNSLKLKNVRTYVQSGNAVFESSAKTAIPMAKKIAARIDDVHGFRPHVLVLKDSELREAVASNPYFDAGLDPKTVHFFFMDDGAKTADFAGMEKLKAPSENFKLAERVFYLHAPNGIGRSKLAAKVEKLFGVPTTARNLRTVQMLLEMANA